MKKAFFILITVIIQGMIYLSCRHHVKELPKPEILIPSGLTYSPNSIQVQTGVSINSVKPGIVGSKPISYSISTDIDNHGYISINSDGVIQTQGGIPVGTYLVSVTAKNSAGTVTFNNVYQVVVSETLIAPSVITYRVDSLNMNNGTGGVSGPPTVEGTYPITFTMSSTPASNGHISISSNTGEITVDSLLPVGDYSVTVTATNSAGTKTFSNVIVISIKPIEASLLSYVPNNLDLVTGNSASSSLPTVNGTTPITYSITSNPSSTGQITINNTTGKITAGAGLAIGTYIITVTATNGAGSVAFANAYEIKVSANVTSPGSLIYSASNLTFTSGQGGSSVAPTVSGTTPITYSLPNGTNSNITINPSTGVITAAGNLPAGTYNLTITATNAAGSSTTSFTITVNPVSAPSNLVYAPNAIIITTGMTGSSGIPSITGSPVTYTMNASPANTAIAINSTTGVITSTSTLPTGTYFIHVTATNTGGSTTFTNAFSITVNAAMPSNLSYTPNSFSVIQGAGGSSVTPTISGSGPFNYSMTSVPANANITINASTGVIVANSSVAVGSYTFSVTVNNVAGSQTFSNVYTVNVSSSATAPSSLNYATNSLTITQGQMGSSVAPTISGTTPITYNISAGNNANISINATTGVITTSSGLASGTYILTVTATNSVGSTTTPYTITVNAVPIPSNLVYSPSSYTVNQGIAGSSATPTITDGPVTYTMTSSPSTGAISINSSTGVLSSTTALAVGTYTISVTATNSGGAKSFAGIYTVIVNAVAPSALVYSPASYSVNQGTAGSSAAPTIMGTPPVTYSIGVSPANANITINSTTGVVSSSASVAVGSYTVTVTATNTAGSTSATYTITVNSVVVPISNLVYSPNSLSVIQGNGGTSVTPSYSGTLPATFSFTPSNANITISAAGIISANTSLTAGTYTLSVTATNSAGSATASYTITVNSVEIPLSGLTYSPNTLNVDHGVSTNSATPTIIGTAPITYKITVSPAAAGISINSTTGVITSATSVALGTYTISVTASSTAGSGSSTTTTYTLAVVPSYALDIASIMSSQCTSCHGGGQSPNLSTYTNVKNNINNVITDVTTTTSTSTNHIMPPSGTKLTTAQVNLLKQWQSTGMLP
jgi:hypothetical protein